jgi:hypothetical protein
MLGQWPLCGLLWIFTRIRVVIFAFVSRVVVVLSAVPTPSPCIMRVWYEVHGWRVGSRFIIVQTWLWLVHGVRRVCGVSETPPAVSRFRPGIGNPVRLSDLDWNWGVQYGSPTYTVCRGSRPGLVPQKPSMSSVANVITCLYNYEATGCRQNLVSEQDWL